MRSEWIADGAHAGLRWYVQHMEGVDAPVVTAIGFIGSAYTSDSCEMPDWTEAAVCRWVEDLVAARTARAVRRAKA